MARGLPGVFELNTNAKNVSDAELDVLKALWDREEGTVRELVSDLHGIGRDWAYTTVQTLLRRLVEKGYVKANQNTYAHVFTPQISRDELVHERLSDLATRVCDGSRTALIMSLYDGHKATADEISHLKALLASLEKQARTD
ncbi:MAG: BlaI/MecI/CopY family transcriptional regulator [Phycisphaeraceae bacterium]|nr:BlaI/MecI/CopY family transcriptional regulator [Phycisphaerales bacterium]MCB9860826.1 BlaI/MecI/CopY family transcriptional regulator [Phycisphaeraceae bacterium]